MRAFVTTASPQVLIALARRDLLALLDKLDRPDSVRTLVSREFLVDEELTQEGLLVVVAEEDEEHQADRPPRAAASDTDDVFLEPATATGEAGSTPVRTDVAPERRRHAAGLLHGWVFRQHQVWVDRHGVEHEVESMPREYVANVIRFCENHAWRMWWAAASDDLLDRLEEITALSNVRPDAAAQRLRGVLLVFEHEAAGDPLEWLRETPLYAALVRRLGAGA
jgi:hypothetical protein